MNRGARLDQLMRLRALRMQVSLQRLRAVDTKLERFAQATEAAERDAIDAKFAASTLRRRTYETRTAQDDAAGFYASMALWQRQAHLVTGNKERHVRRLSKRRAEVARDRADQLDAHVADVRRHDQITERCDHHRRADRIAAALAAEREQQDLLAGRGPDGMS